MKDDVKSFLSLSITVKELPFCAFVDQQNFKLFNDQLDDVFYLSHHPVWILNRTQQLLDNLGGPSELTDKVVEEILALVMQELLKLRGHIFKMALGS